MSGKPSAIRQAAGLLIEVGRSLGRAEVRKDDCERFDQLLAQAKKLGAGGPKQGFRSRQWASMIGTLAQVSAGHRAKQRAEEVDARGMKQLSDKHLAAFELAAQPAGERLGRRVVATFRAGHKAWMAR